MITFLSYLIFGVATNRLVEGAEEYIRGHTYGWTHLPVFRTVLIVIWPATLVALAFCTYSGDINWKKST